MFCVHVQIGIYIVSVCSLYHSLVFHSNEYQLLAVLYQQMLLHGGVGVKRQPPMLRDRSPVGARAERENRCMHKVATFQVVTAIYSACVMTFWEF